jgi:hypothetical protein
MAARPERIIVISVSKMRIGKGFHTFLMKSFASEFSQAQFPIKNALDSRPIHREMPRHSLNTREEKFFQKALKSRAKELKDFPGRFSLIQERSLDLNLLSQFLTMDSEIALS